MLKVDDVTPHPEVGQYWACTRPLYLFRVQFVDTVQVQHTITTWIPGGTPESDCYYVGYEPYLTSRRLSESRVIDPEALEFKETFRTGDVIVFPHFGELAFVVVEGSTVTLYSDWVISKDPAILTQLKLFQRGPVNPNLEPATRFERVLGESTCP